MGSGSVPAPPPMSGEELRLLDAQMGLLGDARKQGQEQQSLFKELSGLYDSSTERGKYNVNHGAKATLRTIGSGVIGSYSDDKDVKALLNAGIDPMTKGTDALRMLERDRGLGKSTGLAGRGKEKTVYSLNPEAVSGLRSRISNYGKRAEEISSLQSDRYLKALKGELPVSEGTTQRKEQEFRLLQEAAARSGNPISGSTPEDAMGMSSAAAQNLGEFRRTYKLIEDAERRGEIAGGGMGAAPGSVGLGYAGQAYGYNPASLLGGYSAVMQPFSAQRGLMYQGQLQNAALRSQGTSAMYGLLGTGIGAYFGSLGGPAGTAAGASLGGSLGGQIGSGYIG